WRGGRDGRKIGLRKFTAPILAADTDADAVAAPEVPGNGPVAGAFWMEVREVRAGHWINQKHGSAALFDSSLTSFSSSSFDRLNCSSALAFDRKDLAQPSTVDGDCVIGHIIRNIWASAISRAAFSAAVSGPGSGWGPSASFI